MTNVDVHGSSLPMSEAEHLRVFAVALLLKSGFELGTKNAEVLLEGNLLDRTTHGLHEALTSGLAGYGRADGEKRWGASERMFRCR